MGFGDLDGAIHELLFILKNTRQKLPAHEVFLISLNHLPHR
jgi:hypothetical protein